MLNIDISNIESQEINDFLESNISDFKNFELSIIFNSDYSQSRIIRNIIVFLFEKNNIGSPWKNRFSLISDELVNNSIEYGSIAYDKNTFFIKFSVTNNCLNINLEVHDTGKWDFSKTSIQMEEIRKEKQADPSAIYLWKRWRWLFQLITNIVDELYFKDKEGWWLIVWVNKTIELL